MKAEWSLISASAIPQSEKKKKVEEEEEEKQDEKKKKKKKPLTDSRRRKANTKRPYTKNITIAEKTILIIKNTKKTHSNDMRHNTPIRRDGQTDRQRGREELRTQNFIR